MFWPKPIYLQIAGFIIKISFKKYNSFVSRQIKLYYAIIERYRGYIILKKQKKIDFQITLLIKKEQRLLYQIKRNFYTKTFQDINKKKLVSYYDLSVSQFNIILLVILQRLLSKNKGFFFHASAIVKDGRAILFTGRNGAGKSTLVNLLKNQYSVLADDKVIIKEQNKQFYCYQDPTRIYKQIKQGLTGYPLKAICFIRKSKHFIVKKINNKNYILNRILKQYQQKKINTPGQLKTLFFLANYFDAFYLLYFAINIKKTVSLVENTSF